MREVSTITPVSISVSVCRRYSLQLGKGSGNPVRGTALNTSMRNDMRPVCSPSQNGELQDSASMCGRKYVSWFIRSMRNSSSSIPTWTCRPQIIMRRAAPCISSRSAT
jgi:hypothetical protein